MAAKTNYIGQRISYDGALCTVRYIGDVAGANGSWLGVEWDDATRGKHDGSHKGVRYFTCLSKAAAVASFVRPSRPAGLPQGFIAALKEKYVGLPSKQDGSQASPIIISGKVAEAVGFDKISRQMAQLDELRIAILDSMRIAYSLADESESISATCPKLVQLDLSRNLFTNFAPIVEICGQLPVLRQLAINGNRFQDVLSDSILQHAKASFQRVTELALGNTLLDWDEICRIISNFPTLSSLTAGSNQLSILPPQDYSILTATLTSINLEYNEFASISDLSGLTSLMCLRDLHLKGNNIHQLASDGPAIPVFPTSLQYLDVSYNDIRRWSFVDNLTTAFPGLTALRLAHNPLHAMLAADAGLVTSDESHMFTIARIAQLRSLDFSTITNTDRSNAEMFYLSRIAKQLATVPETAEMTVIDQHPRYAELCQIYGEPDVFRRQEVNPAFLEARLVNVEFQCSDKEVKVTKIPQAFDIYAVKGIAGRLFNIPPLKIRLVWETGEWDPVAGLDDKDWDSSDGEDESSTKQKEPTRDVENAEEKAKRSGRWVKRELELAVGPRQLGYCIDGLDVRIRVECP